MTLGSFSDPGDKSFADGDGLALFNSSLGNSDQFYNAFEMKFDQPVKLISYNLQWIQDSSGISTTFAQGLNQSVELIGGAGTYSFSNQFLAQANVPISVTSTTNADNRRLAQMNSLTVEKVDLPPATVPGPLPILGFGAAFGFSRRLRHRVAPSPVKVTPADA